MDRRASEIIGLPVITFGKGNKIFNVVDLVIEPERKQVLALLVLEWSLFKSAKAIPFGRIQSIGPDAVVVPDSRAVIDVNRDPVLKKLNDKQNVRGLRVITEEGRKLGEVSDVLLDSKTGEIRGFYVSIGRVLSITQGMRWLPADSVINIGQRVLYVPVQVGPDFEAQSGGWQGALDQAGDRLRAVGARANERLAELGGKAQESGAMLNQQLGQMGDQMRENLPRQASTLVVGRTAHRTVLANDGTPIVSEGDIITEDHVEMARTENRLPQLLMAANVGPMQQYGSTLGGQATQNFADLRTEVRDLWGQLTGSYMRSVDQADERMMQRRIKHALGRPATRVILDNNDNIILNTGDIITNRAIEAAREAGVLDVLVDSVYAERPNLTLADLKAPRSGRASLRSEIITSTAREASATQPAAIETSVMETKLLDNQSVGIGAATPTRGRGRSRKTESTAAATLPTEPMATSGRGRRGRRAAAASIPSDQP